MIATCHRPTVPTYLLAVGVMLIVARLIAGCLERPAQDAAAAGYEAQQMRCVEQYANKVDIDRCRNRVKLAWTVDRLLDAGGDR